MPVVTRAPLFGVIGPRSLTPPLTNLSLWLKADALALSDGDLVASWTDSSGNNNHAVQATAANKPTYYTNAISDKPAVWFDGANASGPNKDFLSLTSNITASGNLTVFVVWRRGNIESDGALFGGAANDGLSVAVKTGASEGVIRIANSGSTTFDDGDTAWPNGGWTCTSFTKSSTTYTQRLNFAANGNSTTAGTPGVISTIGAFAAPDTYWEGYIAEILIYSAVLSGADITTVESYLIAKYNGVIGQTRLLWLKANAITGLNDGDNVVKWNDSSGQGCRVITPTPGHVIYKTNVQNSLPGVRFDTDGTAGMSIDCPLGAMPYSVYIVYDYRSASSANRRALQGRVNNWLIGPYSNIHRAFTGGFSTGLTVTQNVFVAQWIIGSGGNNTNNVNNTAYTSGGSSVPGWFGLSTFGAFGEPLDGDILEVIVENRADDSTQQGDTWTYLDNKYNL